MSSPSGLMERRRQSDKTASRYRVKLTSSGVWRVHDGPEGPCVGTARTKDEAWRFVAERERADRLKAIHD